MLNIGIKGHATTVSRRENSAKHMKSGELAVFATPSMIALMEEAAGKSVSEYLENGQTTVGTMIYINHVSATPIGMDIRCESELTEIDGRRLLFKVAAFDDCGEIGKGVHERFIVDSTRFMTKTNSKISG